MWWKKPQDMMNESALVSGKHPLTTFFLSHAFFRSPPLDDRMAALGCFYVRYMDDWVILAPTRWKLRKAIKATNQVMSELRVIKHPDKTFIGRVARGFDFLGYWFSPVGLGIARKTVERMVENMPQCVRRVHRARKADAYFQRWCRWVKGGISAKLRTVVLA